MSLVKKASMFAAVFVGLFAGSARAQDLIAVNVPFPFLVRGQELPAGPYDIRSQDTDHGVLSIRGKDNDSSIFVMMLHAGGHDPAGDEPALVFTHYEGKYLLSQIWESGTDGLAFPEASIAPRRAAAQPVASEAPTVVLAVHWK